LQGPKRIEARRAARLAAAAATVATVAVSGSVALAAPAGAARLLTWETRSSFVDPATVRLGGQASDPRPRA
jgi:hypothetical protein